MAIFVNEMKPMLIYKGNYVLPINKKDRNKGSIVYLLTPTINSSINYMNSLYPINQLNYKSYFLEKNVQLILDSNLQEANVNGQVIDASNNSLLEAFNNMPYQDEVKLTEDSLIFNDTDNKQNRLIFSDVIDEMVDDTLLDEADTQFTNAKYNFNNMLKMLLFHERMKNQSDCLKLYEEIKAQVKYIQYTFVDTNLYKNKNLFYDWSYYTEIFFKNNKFIGDKALDLFWNFIQRFLRDKRFDQYNHRTIVIPVNDWISDKNTMFDFKKSITPISMIFRGLRQRDGLFDIFGNYEVLFTSENRFFKMDFNDEPEKQIPRFMNNVSRLIIETDTADQHLEEKEDSKEVIILKVADRLKKSGIKLDNLTVSTSSLNKEDLNKKGLLNNPIASEDIEVKKAALMNKIEKAANGAKTEEDVIDSIDSDEKDKELFADILRDLSSEESTKMDKTRQARYDSAKTAYMKTDIRGKSVKELLKQFETNNELQETAIPIDSIDDHWQHVKFPNFNEVYTKEDMQADIVAMYNHFNNTTHPMNIVKIEVENTSTSEDYKDTWHIQFEDAETGKRFTSNIDIPRMVGNRFMKLRGNEKVLIGQIMLLPIVKTDEDTVQIVSNYNKIFVRRKSPSGYGKSSIIVNKLSKALMKYKGREMKVFTGSNAKIYKRYELPVTYIDLGSVFSKIQFKDGSYITFNNDNLNKIPFERKGLPKDSEKLTDAELAKKYPASCFVNSSGKREVCNDANKADEYILDTILTHAPSFNKDYEPASVSKRLMFSEASILNAKIPVIVVASYSIGLQKVLERAGIKFELSEKRPDKAKHYFRFEDGYLVYYPESKEDHMLMNGLAQINTEDFSLSMINSKDMWLSVLDDYGGRIKADGLDNFFDLMMDPITQEICERLGLPKDYIGALLYASGLLIDNKFNRHTDITGNRIRINEVIVGHLYQVLAREYGAYRNMVKRNKGDARFTVKQSAVIDSVLNHDQTSSDLSTLTPLLEAEAASKVTFKGLSGMNSERAFSIEKRSYDDSMLGVLGLSTGFANTVGINRQTTIDAGILNKRGFIAPKKPNQLDNLSTFSIMEGLSPLAINRDDGMRTCMAFTQTVQHQMSVRVSMPNLVTTGTDEALAYLTSNKFSYKFKGKKGKVLEVTSDYIVIQDLDTKECDFIDLREKIQKNSDGGFFVTTKLDANKNIKPGTLLKYNDIVAYNKSSYSPSIGNTKDPNSLSYNLGTLAKVAIAMSDLGFEDSCVVDEYLSEALTIEICMQKEINLPPTANLYQIVKVGDHIEEGEPLLIFSDQFEDEDANEILRNMIKDTSVLSDIGRKQVHSKCTGTIQDIKIYRTCELSALSPTLQKFVKEVESKTNKLKSIMKKHKIDKEYELDATYKLAQEGKLKNVEGLRIEIYVKTVDIFGIGDKQVFGNGLKGVCSYIINRDEIATSEHRPTEAVNTFLAMTGVAARMVPSAMLLGLTNKALIELTRQTQEDLGIKPRMLHEILEERIGDVKTLKK